MKATRPWHNSEKVLEALEERALRPRRLRDRRMRLSLNVARRFFGLQDMLGFDKASNIVEWLLNQAKAEINRLAKEKTK
ncbi:hypothetical protein VIGAN_01405000 [Vigna angularis var. angularis]|uniref:TCP domain-containing protein n=1 Tax=Vigna angularis var. angularis TaxID=157739 RepID=A0A0S3R605_PHAAN|nr:hypothetical protein VIGAN_01405000 [Vigna angularis var. angularis]